VSASLHHHRGERPRDPRVDPARFDQLERNGLTYTVAEADLFSVTVDVSCVHHMNTTRIGLRQWQRLMVGARVVSVGRET
jgi:hypothetical protein